MRISVVIPAYNRADLIGETLDAILGQTLAPFEVIVVDDGSRDATWEVLQSYAPRVRSIRIENSGDLVARNAGLRLATGDLVAFCDSDDLWRPNFLEAMAGLWRREPGLLSAYCDFVVVQDGEWGTARKFDAAPASFWQGMRPLGEGAGVFDMAVADRLVGFQPFFASCVVVDRAAFVAQGGWDEGASRMLGSDFATALRIAEHPPIGILRAPLAGIRRHAGNFSASVQKMNLGDAKVLEYVLASRPSMQEHAGLIRASVVRRRLDALESAFARREFAVVRETAALIGPGELAGRARLKAWVAGLPGPLADAVASLLFLPSAVRAAIGGR